MPMVGAGEAGPRPERHALAPRDEERDGEEQQLHEERASKNVGAARRPAQRLRPATIDLLRTAPIGHDDQHQRARTRRIGHRAVSGVKGGN